MGLEFLSPYYWVKIFHIAFVVAWMAGLLYLPRIFVYHAETKSDEVKSTFKVMERRLFVYIMNPAMILSWLFGLILIHSIGIQSFSEFWLIAKIALVLLLTFYHFFLFNCLNNFSFDRNKRSSKFYRVINEVPTVVLIVIIFLVIFKPI